MLRLGFEAKMVFSNFTGMGNYSRTLLKNLSYYYPDFGYFLYTPYTVSHPETKFFLNSPLFSVHQPSQIQRPLWSTTGLRKEIKRHRINLFHGLTHSVPPALEHTDCVKVVTIHDLAFKKHPELLPLVNRYHRDRRTSYAIRQADHIVVPSQSTRQDVMTYFKVREKDISVVYQSVHERFIQDKSDALVAEVIKKYQLPQNYMLYVGDITPRKNLLRVVEAMHLMPKHLDPYLVVVGKGKNYFKKVLRLIQRHKLQNRIQFVQPTFEDLPFIFQHADLFVYPSLYEGFGIPVLEALFCHVPVLTSTVSALPEVAGPGAYLVDPLNQEAISSGMQTLLTDTDNNANRIAKGNQHAQQFTGEMVSKSMVAVYRNLLGADDLEGSDL